MTPGDLSIKAEPSKAFFIHMLTRDISLVECILDLLNFAKVMYITLIWGAADRSNKTVDQDLIHYLCETL